MSSRFIEKLTEENLCSYFILPLLGLNKLSFLLGNFVESYIIKQRLYVFRNTKGLIEGCYFMVVEVVNLDIISPRFIKKHHHYASSRLDSITGNYLIYYMIPTHCNEDVELFIAGQFSKLSERAKNAARANSTLPYEAKDRDGSIVTDARLMALDLNKQLRQMWERELLVTIPEESELLSIPDERTYKEFPLIEKEQS